MSSPQDEIDALIAKVAALTARVYQLEQKAGLEPEASQRRVSQPEIRPPAAPPGPPPATAPPTGMTLTPQHGDASGPRPSIQMSPPQGQGDQMPQPIDAAAAE